IHNGCRTKTCSSAWACVLLTRPSHAEPDRAMYTLIISIACSVAVSVLLKLARRHNLQIDQAIAVNYVVAASLCLLIFRPSPASLLSPTTPWWILAALGVLLPTIFLAMAGAVRHAGIVLSDAAQRLSLFIPLRSEERRVGR